MLFLNNIKDLSIENKGTKDEYLDRNTNMNNDTKTARFQGNLSNRIPTLFGYFRCVTLLLLSPLIIFFSTSACYILDTKEITV